MGHAQAIEVLPGRLEPPLTRGPMALRSASESAGPPAPEHLAAAAWVARPVLALLRRRSPVAGRALGAGYVEVGGAVLALVPEGAPRMPNGIASPLPAPASGTPVWIGAGRVQAGPAAIAEGPAWDPVARVRVRLRADPPVAVDALALAGRGGGLTPYGDDVLAGYAAGLVLWRGDRARAATIAVAAAPRTTSLAATLLRHAARGELPEPAHALLERGDPDPLCRFGHSSGRGLLLGLALACPDPPPPGAGRAVVPPAESDAPRATVWVSGPGA
jgi:hypothetical protein